MSETARCGLELSITAVFVLALLLVGAVLIFSGGTSSAKQIATLRIYGGEVRVQHRGDVFRLGSEGESLREGDSVRTGPDGRAAIDYFDGSQTRLDFDTTFAFVTLETLGNTSGSKVIEAEQVDGNSYNLVAELADAESRFEVETPSATASVQGTVYGVIVEDGSTTVAVIEGQVSTTGDSGTVDVPAGTMVVVSAEGRWASSRTSPTRCSTATGSPSIDASSTVPRTAHREEPVDPVSRRSLGARPCRGSPTATGLRITGRRPSTSAMTARLRRRRRTSRRMRASRPPRPSGRPRCTFGSRTHRPIRTATRSLATGASGTVPHRPAVASPPIDTPTRAPTRSR